MKLSRLFHLLALLAIAVIAPRASATTYYCNPLAANDSGNALTEGTAKKSLQAVFDIGALTAGDTILIMPGVIKCYTETNGVKNIGSGTEITFRDAGTITAPITIQAQKGLYSVIFEGDDSIDDGNTQNMLRIGVKGGTPGTSSQANWVIIRNLMFVRSGGCGMSLHASNNVAVLNCVFAGNNKSGLLAGYCQDLTIMGCTSYGNMQEHGFYISNSSDRGVMRNLVSYNNASNSFQFNGDPSQADVDFGEAGDGICSSCRISGTIAYGNGRGATNLGTESPFFPSPENDNRTGTITSAAIATGASTITDNTKSWTTGEHSKYPRQIVITSGPLNGTVYDETAANPNTATTLTTTSTFTSQDVTDLVGATYKIVHAPGNGRGSGTIYSMLNCRFSVIENNLAYNEFHKVLVYSTNATADSVSYYSSDNVFKHNTCITSAGAGPGVNSGARRNRCEYNILSISSGTGVYTSDARQTGDGTLYSSWVDATHGNVAKGNYVVNTLAGSTDKIHGYAQNGTGGSGNKNWSQWQASSQDTAASGASNSLPTFKSSTWPYDFHPVSGSPVLDSGNGVWVGCYRRYR